MSNINLHISFILSVYQILNSKRNFLFDKKINTYLLNYCQPLEEKGKIF